MTKPNPALNQPALDSKSANPFPTTHPMLYIALLVIVAVAAFFAGAHNAKRAASLKGAALDAAKSLKK